MSDIIVSPEMYAKLQALVKSTESGGLLHGDLRIIADKDAPPGTAFPLPRRALSGLEAWLPPSPLETAPAFFGIDRATVAAHNETMQSAIEGLRRSISERLYGVGHIGIGREPAPPPRDLAADALTLRRALRAAMLDGRLPRAGYNVHRARDGIRLRVERVPFAVLDPQKHVLLAGWRTAPGWSTRYMVKPRTRSGPFTAEGRGLLTSLTAIMRETRVWVTVDTQDRARLVRTLAAPCGHDDCFEHEALERACRAAK